MICDAEPTMINTTTTAPSLDFSSGEIPEPAPRDSANNIAPEPDSTAITIASDAHFAHEIAVLTFSANAAGADGEGFGMAWLTSSTTVWNNMTEPPCE